VNAVVLPAIVVNAYNRPTALARLLNSLQQAVYPATAEVPLVISIDHGGDREVQTLAEGFAWPHGTKTVIVQAQHLGLVQHFLACGDLTQRYEAIVYLEDDLTVSPVFYAYAAQVLSFYQHDDRIAGLSLFGLWFNGYTQQPFMPLPDGSDAFFVQVPYTQGLAFKAAQWARFAAWRQSPLAAAPATMPLHEAWSRFDREDWFPLLARFVITTDRYFVFPRVSHTTGWGDAGTHFSQASRFFQLPLQRRKTGYDFKTLDEADAVYDSFFELHPDRLNRLTDQLRGYDCTIDLYATKSRVNLRAAHVLTSRHCRNPIVSFGKTAWPIEMNVVERVPGVEISLCRVEDVRWDRLAQLHLWRSNYEYFARGRTPKLTTVLKLAAARLLKTLLSSSSQTSSWPFVS
jgi:hypothetical protein